MACLRRSESSFRTRTGHWLYQRSWLPTPVASGAAGSGEAERALLLVHGLAEHSGRYERVASWFAARGCAVHAYDQRGHGRSEGERCYVGRFDEYLDDLEQVLARVRAVHPDLPLFLLGHSMGGLVVSAFLAERKPAVSGAVATGAALSLSPLLSGLRLAAARAASLFAPRLRVPVGLDANGLSRDPEVVRAYQADPYVERRVSLSLAVEIASAARRTLASGQRVGVPLLLLHGEADPICEPTGSAQLHATVGTPGSRFRSYANLRHEILNEPEAPAVMQEILEWLQARSKVGVA
jgi:alpha-beta hydrolase superfamily lysophospholipase